MTSQDTAPTRSISDSIVRYTNAGLDDGAFSNTEPKTSKRLISLSKRPKEKQLQNTEEQVNKSFFIHFFFFCISFYLKAMGDTKG